MTAWPVTSARLAFAAVFANAMAALFVPAAAAQPSSTASTQPSARAPNAMLSKNEGQPIKIESVSLEVRDKDKVATFIDNVKLVQGDTTLECKRLVVYYDEEATPGAKKGKPAAKPAPRGPEQPAGQQIRKLEAKGSVVLTSKDQVATGENGTYDMKSKTMVLTGDVTLKQGQNVVRGQKLFVDMETGISRVEAAAGQGGRVDALILPQSRDEAKPGATSNSEGGRTNGRAAGAASDKDKPKAGTQRPMKLN